VTYDHLRYGLYGWFALVAAVALLGATACGGPPRSTRVAVAQLGEGLNVADEAVAAEVTTRGEASRAQVREEVAAGMIADVEAGLARFEELMTPTTEARTALRVARESLFALEGALDAWAAGSAPEANFLAVAACAVAALTRLGAILEALEVELPAALVSGLQTIGALATSACPESDDG